MRFVQTNSIFDGNGINLAGRKKVILVLKRFEQTGNHANQVVST